MKTLAPQTPTLDVVVMPDAAQLAALEARMPAELPARTNVRMRLEAIGLAATGATVITVYVGLPLASAVNTLAHTQVLAGVVSTEIIGGTAVVVVGILLRTSRPRGAGQVRSSSELEASLESEYNSYQEVPKL
jgi:hypothetical protein